MQLKKKLNDKALAGADYTENGIALRVKVKDDKYMNSVAIIEVVDGKPRLTIFDDTLERYGIEVAHETVSPEVW